MTPALRTILLGGWTPLALGSSLLAWWDAERPDLITAPGGAMSIWRDIVGGYDVTQAVGASKPVYSATSFNGRPGVSFDGIDDELTGAFPASFPTGAIPNEIWGVTSQDALAADVSSRVVAACGAGSFQGRSLERTVVSGANRAFTRVGNGAANLTAIEGTVDFSGRHVCSAIIDGSNIFGEIDTVVSAATACTPLTSGLRVRLGASAANTASSYWSGTHSAILITSIITAMQRAQLYAYFNRRL